MKNKKHKYDKDEISGIAVLQKIKSGEASPKTLLTEERKACSNILKLFEGYSDVQTAQLLQCSEKTVYRDRMEARKNNSLNPSIEFVGEWIGEIIRKAEIHASYLMRLARSNEGSVSERAQAEFLSWRIRKELTDKLQSAGYLPLMAQHVKGEFLYHLEHADSGKDISESKKALEVIETTAKATDTFDAESEKQIRQLKSRIEKAEIESEIDKLSKEQDKTLGGQNESDKQ